MEEHLNNSRLQKELNSLRKQLTLFEEDKDELKLKCKISDQQVNDLKHTSKLSVLWCDIDLKIEACKIADPGVKTNCWGTQQVEQHVLRQRVVDVPGQDPTLMQDLNATHQWKIFKDSFQLCIDYTDPTGIRGTICKTICKPNFLTALLRMHEGLLVSWKNELILNCNTNIKM